MYVLLIRIKSTYWKEQSNLNILLWPASAFYLFLLKVSLKEGHYAQLLLEILKVKKFRINSNRHSYLPTARLLSFFWFVLKIQLISDSNRHFYSIRKCSGCKMKPTYHWIQSTIKNHGKLKLSLVSCFLHAFYLSKFCWTTAGITNLR